MTTAQDIRTAPNGDGILILRDGPTVRIHHADGRRWTIPAAPAPYVAALLGPARMASCPYCRAVRPSSPALASFESRPDRLTDGFYCGCRGWE